MAETRFWVLHKAFQRELLCKGRMPLDDRELEQISKMLERGGKMLADHCVVCKSPLFKFEGKTICPVCTYRETQSAEHAPDSPAQGLKREALPPEATTPGQGVPLDSVITELIAALAFDMRTETDLARINTQLDCIERGLRIIQLIRGIDFATSDTRHA